MTSDTKKKKQSEVTEDVWYNDVASKSIQNSPAKPVYGYFGYRDNTFYAGKPINALRMAVHTAGTLTYGKTTGTTVTDLGTITLEIPSKDLQVYKIPEITLTSDEYLVVSKTSDNGLFYYGTSNNGVSAGRFVARVGNGANITTGNLDVGNLSIDFGYVA